MIAGVTWDQGSWSKCRRNHCCGLEKYIRKPTFLFGVLGRLGSVRVFLFDVGVSAFRLQRACSAPGEDRGGHGLFVLHPEPRLGRFDSGHDV